MLIKSREEEEGRWGNDRVISQALGVVALL
jgi:hypothetical protein